MDYAELMELARIGKGLQRLPDLQRARLRE